MQLATHWVGEERDQSDSDLAELRIDSLCLLAPSLIAAGAAVIVATGIASDVLRRETWVVGAALSFIGFVVSKMLRGGVGILPATVTIIVGLCATLTGAIFLYAGTPVAVLFCLVVVLAGALLGLRSSLGMALGVTILVIGLTQIPGQFVTDGVAAMTLVLVWTAVYTSWLASRPLQAALDWYGHSYDQALRTTQEARTRQGELGRVSKSLEEACIRLEQLARDLDRARQAAEDARKLKAQFAAAVSHELRTPLNLIIGFSELMVITPRLSYGQPLPERYASDVDAIYRNACHISSLIDDILDLGQIDADRMGIQRRESSLAQIVETAVAGLAARIRAQGLTLTVDVPVDLPPVLVDPTRVRQILINLLINAVRFTDSGGITISARARDNVREVLVSIADTGVGIAADDLPHVFDEFNQSGEPTRRRGGSGLGLTVSKRFAELHGGNMWADSKLGQGSTFHFNLPLCENVVTSPYESRVSIEALPAINVDGRTVVVIDKIGDTARVLGRYLDGYTVLRAENPGQARQFVEAGVAGAVVVDSLDSQESWNRLRLGSDRQRHVPVVFCPLYNVRSVAGDLGAGEYLVKPVSRPRLKAALRTALTGKKLTYDRRTGPGATTAAPLTVLIAEDDPEMLGLLVRMIRSFSKRYEVWTARDGEECLARLERDRPDLLLLDLLMPVVDGYGVLERIRTNVRLKDLPVVVISAKSLEEERVVAGTMSIARDEGLSVAEAVHWLKGSLDFLIDGSSGRSEGLTEGPAA